MQNIYLVGFMGTGKTTVGKTLARRLNKEFLETDAVIEKDEAKTITDIFAQEGEAYFRELEKNVLSQISPRSDLVISCGGGLICDPGNLNLLKQNGLLICLTASADVIYARTKKYTRRPLLKVENPLKKIEELLTERKPYYDQADYIIDTNKLSSEEVVDRIIQLIRMKK